MFFHGSRFLGAPGTFPGAPADKPEASTLIWWGASRGSSFEKGALGWKVPKVMVEETRNSPGAGLEGLGGDGYFIDSEAQIQDVLSRAKESALGGRPVVVNVRIGKTEFRKGSISI